MKKSFKKKHPLVSVLVTTFNRKKLLKRCIDRILNQTYQNLELIIIDDASTDGTETIINKIKDKRIKYIKNKNNLGSKFGDRIHINKFVNKLSKGKYFVYVCDDDYWIPDNLLEYQVKIFNKFPNLSMVVGGQLSCFIEEGKTSPLIKTKYKVGKKEYKEFIDEIINDNDNFANLSNSLHPKFQSSEDFLYSFAKSPFTYNILTGATLYNRDIFQKSKTLANNDGSKWQAGYEIKLGPGSYGGCYNIIEPCLFAEVKETNASFRGTQISHYFDCIKSIKVALSFPIKETMYSNTKFSFFLKKIKKTVIKSVGRSFLRNTIQIKIYKKLTLCSEDNINSPVRHSDVFITNLKNFTFDFKSLLYACLLLLPSFVLRYLYEKQIFILIISLKNSALLNLKNSALLKKSIKLFLIIVLFLILHMFIHEITF